MYYRPFGVLALSLRNHGFHLMNGFIRAFLESRWVNRLAPETSTRRRWLRRLKKVLRSLRDRGWWETWRQARRQLRYLGMRSETDRLRVWFREQQPTRRELREQRRWSRAVKTPLRFVLLLPLTQDHHQNIVATIRGVCRQTYPHWRLVLAVTPETSPPVIQTLRRLEHQDPRIRLIVTPPGTTADACRNEALAAVAGDFLAVLRAGDGLAEEALYQMARFLQDHPQVDGVYTDETVFSRRINSPDMVILKPDWAPEQLLSYDYCGRLTLVRRTRFQEVGGFRPEYGAAQDWDLYLRLSERGYPLRRLPRCLYHRQSETVSYGSPSTDAFRQALADHVRRRGWSAEVENRGNGTFRLRWRLSRQPLVSIIIANRNQATLLRSCLDGLLFHTHYQNIEIIIVENHSTDADVFQLYDDYSSKGWLRVVPFADEFNYSAVCNTGARAARGDLLLFLNNDVEVIDPDWLADLIGWASLPGVGVVGTQLRYPDGSLQHAGVVVGLNLVGLLYHRQTTPSWTIFGTPDCYHDYSAVIGACQMIPRQVFEELGGFDERYRLAHSDVAFCFRARKAGYRIVYTPDAALLHHEGATRGTINPPLDLERLAGELRELELYDDPYFHPCLNVQHSVPRVRLALEPTPEQSVREQVHGLHPIMAHPVLDVYDAAAMKQYVARHSCELSWPALPLNQPWTDVWQAVHFILYVLYTHPDVRRRFPRALSEGEDGAFCRWIGTTGLLHFGLPDEAVTWLRAAFQLRPGHRVRQIYAFRADLRRAHPAALLPVGRADFLCWLLIEGKKEYALRDEQIWWFLLESAEDPGREALRTYWISPDWQRKFPDLVTARRRAELQRWLMERWSLPLESIRNLANGGRPVPGGSLQSEASRPPLALPALIFEQNREPRANGVNVLGHFCYPSGLQTSVRGVVQALNHVGIPTSCRDVPADIHSDDPERSPYLGLEPYDISLIHVQPEPYFETCYERAGLHPRPDVRRIALWYWELEQVPKHWAHYCDAIQEVWTATRFIADALRPVVPVPVVRMLPGVQLGPMTPFNRADLHIEADRCLFLFLFDMNSIMERKNPLGLIEAYRRAFRKDDRVALIIKVARGREHPKEFARLTHAARKAGVLVLDEIMPRSRLHGLMRACDCYISLHRSEGFGLTLAEAMLMGKPVIGTAYSGNMDFMHQLNSLLVDYELVELRKEVYPYPAGSVWAQPAIPHAAELMRWVYEHRDEAAQLGQQAARETRELLSLEAAGRRLAERLRQCRTGTSVHADSPGVGANR